MRIAYVHLWTLMFLHEVNYRDIIEHGREIYDQIFMEFLLTPEERFNNL